MASFTKGDHVRYIDGREGTITGETQPGFWEVEFGNSDTNYCEEDYLELLPSHETPEEKFKNRHYAGCEALRRAINRHRLSGDLTNILYAVENKTAKYLPHQFIPVLKFLSSSSDRLLIADEVGLGKTIEAMYIWEELRARENARRLLVVAPAVLREKWKKDMKKFFDIDAQIVSAQNGSMTQDSLLSKLVANQEYFGYKPFALIVSLEGLRVAKELRQYVKTRGESDVKLFDLVVIDEAHYLRNPDTESFRTGRELRDATSNLLLLSATPIQTSVHNFFNLLRLLAPTEFSNYDAFLDQIARNINRVRLANALEGNKTQSDILEALSKAIKSSEDTNSDLFREIELFAHSLDNKEDSKERERTRFKLIRRLKSDYFYDRYVSRMRKRDVDENRAIRHVATINFQLSETELAFYEQVSDYLHKQDVDEGLFNSFRLIARQRQLASCMPAALRTWRGVFPGTNEEGGENDFGEYASRDFWPSPSTDSVPMPKFENINLARLEAEDSKFNSFVKELRTILNDNPKEKVVVFSFFRGTVLYLVEKLEQYGISCTFILGGVPADEKTERIDRFRETDISVLVSSEVGSEGIDLQFARYEINYDLPWNPMRLEQRIGRIDRIGQTSHDLYIFNACTDGTIEGRILGKLYGRIKVFQDVIGDLEEVLGEKISALELEVFRNRSRYRTKEEEDRLIQQFEQALVIKAKLSEEISLQAGMLTRYQQFVLDGINETRRNHRLVSAVEMQDTIMGFLHRNYPGSSLQNDIPNSGMSLLLSPNARSDFSKFLEDHPQYSSTNLNVSIAGVPCRFGPVEPGFRGETISVRHPLVKWIVSQWAGEPDACAVSIRKQDLDDNIAPGRYVFLVHRWESKGVRNENELHFALCKCGEGILIPPQEAERLIGCVLRAGTELETKFDEQTITDMDISALESVKTDMFNQFSRFKTDHEGYNESMFNERTKYVESVYKTKIANQEAAIQRLKEEGRPTHMQEGTIRKLEEEHSAKLKTLEENRRPRITFSNVACGIVSVTEE